MVDDNQDAAESLALLLEMSGHAVIDVRMFEQRLNPTHRRMQWENALEDPASYRPVLALCVIETRRVDITPFDEVPEDFAATEGEGDGSLRYWQDAHWAYFARECQRIGKAPDRRMPVVCERFEVVFRGS